MTNLDFASLLSAPQGTEITTNRTIYRKVLDPQLVEPWQDVISGDLMGSARLLFHISRDLEE